MMISPEGECLNHRKLKPTGSERVVWGDGQKDYFPVMQTPWGPMGNLICWESYMPLARVALYQKFEEVHLQRAYPLSEVKRLLTEAGMTFVAAYDVLTHEEPGPECERMYIVAREGHQDGKMYL